MNVRTRLHKARVWLHTRRTMGNLETIDAVRLRNPDFEELRDRIRHAGTDSLAHFGSDYTFEGGLYLQQNPDEFAALTLFLRERGPHGNYMEIGSASGGACLFLYREVGFQTVVSLDNGVHARAFAQKEHFSKIANFKQFLGDSHSEYARRFLQAKIEGKLDVAFIDGDHSFKGVWQDLQLSLPFCRRGALVIFHDTVACDGVREAWLRGVSEELFRPLAEFIAREKPLGIAVAAVI